MFSLINKILLPLRHHLLSPFKQTTIAALHTCFYLYSKRSQINKYPYNTVQRVVFICYGNICRSAFAEMAAKKLAADRNLSITFESFGLFAKKGKTSPENAIHAAQAYGVDLTHHKARSFNSNNISATDLIIGMDYSHFDQLNRALGKNRNVFLLRHFVSPRFSTIDIDDPYGKNISTFLNCYNDIIICINHLLQKLCAGRL